MTYSETCLYIDSLNLKNDDAKLTFLNSCKSETARHLVMSSLESDSLKISLLDTLSKNANKIKVIASLSSDDDKLNCALKFKSDFDKSNIAAYISDDKYKMALIDTIKNDYAISFAAIALSQIDNQLDCLHRMKNIASKIYLIDSMYLQNDDLSKYIDFLHYDIDKALIISTINNDKIKLSFYKQLKDDNAKTQVLISLNSDDLKLKHLHDIKNSSSKAMLISTLHDNNLKLKLFNLHPNASNLIIPSDMTVGIELECEGKNSAGLNRLDELIPNWNVKEEFSLNEGIEIVSPILHNSNNKDIALVCDILKALGQTTSNRCGGHIHIGKDYLKSQKAYLTLLELWAASEKILYLISNDSNDIPRPSIMKYAKPVSKKIEKLSFLFNLRKNKPTDIVTNIVRFQKDRHYSINFQNINQQHKKGGIPALNTIEFRLSNGSLSSETWIENINLFGSIIVAAQNISDIRKKPLSERTPDETKKLDDFNLIKQNTIKQDDKLDLLLDLCLPTSLHHIYQKRYYDNKLKLAKQVNFNKRLDSAINNEIVNFNIDEIGKDCFTGKHAVNGVDIAKAQNRIHSDLQSVKEQENVR